MHYMKLGNAIAISEELREAAAASLPFPFAAQIDTALNLKGMSHDQIYSVSIARQETTTDRGVVLPPAMGMATSINFQRAGQNRIATTGDFVLTASQVQPVARVGATPMLYFMHFWAAAPSDNVLPGLRAAIDVLRATQ